MKKYILAILFVGGFLVSCGNSDKKEVETKSAVTIGQSESKPKPVKYDKVDGVAVDMNNKGIGPVSSVTLADEVDTALAEEGEEIYNMYCLACHKPDKKFIGPAPKGVLEIRSPEWVMNMILNPDEMVKKDPIAKQLLLEYNGSPMANQGLTEDQARAILEYFRTL